MLNAEIPNVTFGAHYDTFHIDDRGYNQVDSIKELGGRIIHVHVNGTGRRPAGGEGDELNWQAICSTLTEDACYTGIATNEPFCDTVRKNVPALGEGLPPAVAEPGGIIKTAETITAAGLLAS